MPTIKPRKRKSDGLTDRSGKLKKKGLDWDEFQWRHVASGDDVLVGNEAEGFMSLEELDASEWVPEGGQLPGAPHHDAPAGKQQAKGAKAKGKAKSQAKARSEEGEDEGDGDRDGGVFEKGKGGKGLKGKGATGGSIVVPGVSSKKWMKMKPGGRPGEAMESDGEDDGEGELGKGGLKKRPAVAAVAKRENARKDGSGDEGRQGGDGEGASRGSDDDGGGSEDGGGVSDGAGEGEGLAGTAGEGDTGGKDGPGPVPPGGSPSQGPRRPRSKEEKAAVRLKRSAKRQRRKERKKAGAEGAGAASSVGGQSGAQVPAGMAAEAGLSGKKQKQQQEQQGSVKDGTVGGHTLPASLVRGDGVSAQAMGSKKNEPASPRQPLVRGERKRGQPGSSVAGGGTAKLGGSGKELDDDGDEEEGDVAPAGVPLEDAVEEKGGGGEGGAKGDGGDVVPADTSAWAALGLHPLVLKGIKALGFQAPLPIQERCIPAAARDHKDVVGAAQTGSGKTLAFGIPIIQRLLEQRDREAQREAQRGADVAGDSAAAGAARRAPVKLSGKLRALIVAPTRELAMQVCDHIKAVARFTGIRIVPIVGGIAPQKQVRLLGLRPEVVVATPGRLWDLMSSGEKHLLEVDALSFLVLDEADRMVDRGHFKELADILEQLVARASSTELASRDASSGQGASDHAGAGGDEGGEGEVVIEEVDVAEGGEGEGEELEGEEGKELEGEDEEGEEGSSDSGSVEGFQGGDEEADEDEDARDQSNQGKGPRGMRGKEASGSVVGGELKGRSAVGQKGRRGQEKGRLGAEEDEGGNSKGKERAWRVKARWQTLVFSATLALSAELKRKLKHGGGGKYSVGGGGGKGGKGRGGAEMTPLEALMARIPFMSPLKPAIVDLTTDAIVAHRVQESVIYCLENESDVALYYLLRVHPGKTLLFCNAISALRRVAALLAILRYPCWALHASMQQRQRLKALERFQSCSEGVLVATDVAARGIDIPNITTVIHYQIPLTTEVYVHRAGRTARGFKEGLSVALVSPADRAKFLRLCRGLHKGDGLPEFPVDFSLMKPVTEQVKLAHRIDEIQRRQDKTKAKDTWVQRHAKELELEMDPATGLAPSVPQKSKGRNREEEEAEAVALRQKQKQEEGALRVMRKQLDEMLARPLLPPSTSLRYLTKDGATQLLMRHAAMFARKQQQEEWDEPRGGGGRKKSKRKRLLDPQLGTLDHGVRTVERDGLDSLRAALEEGKAKKRRKV